MAEKDLKIDRTRESLAERAKPEEPPAGRATPGGEERVGKECPRCRTLNDHEARFCAECGYDFIGKTTCPKCGAKVLPRADICEACGAWLLDGICKFCGAGVEDGQIRCGECGNPVDGVVCPKCGKLNFFDFCKTCMSPLTSAANDEMARVRSSALKPPSKEVVFKSKQEARRRYMAYMVCLQEQESPAPMVQADEREQLLGLKRYLEQSEGPTKRRAIEPLFNRRQRNSIRAGDLAATAEIQHQREERKRLLKEVSRLLEEALLKLREQEDEAARKQQAEAKLKQQQEEEERRRRRHGWRCNRYGVVHPDGPCACSAPEYGGEWLDA